MKLIDGLIKRRAEPQSARFEVWANSIVHFGDGIRMMTAQAANEALRHCRIGKVTKKDSVNLNRT